MKIKGFLIVFLILFLVSFTSAYTNYNYIGNFTEQFNQTTQFNILSDNYDRITSYNFFGFNQSWAEFNSLSYVKVDNSTNGLNSNFTILLWYKEYLGIYNRTRSIY